MMYRKHIVDKLLLAASVFSAILIACPRGTLAQDEIIPPPPRQSGATPDTTDPTRAYNPATGQNMFWDCRKKAWIDSKTGEIVNGRFEGKLGADGKIIPPPPAQSGATPDSTDPRRAYNPDTGQNMFWDTNKKSWIDSKTGLQVTGRFKGKIAAKPCPPPPDKIGYLDNKTDVFLGFAYVRAPDEPATNLLGFNGSAFYNINQNVAVGGDFTAAFGSEQFGTTTNTSVRRFTYLFGPQFSFHPNDKVKVFVHPLFGGVHDTIKTRIGTTSGGFSANAFAMAFGGGVDVRVNDRVAVRPFQLDFIPTRFGGNWQNNYRFSTGFVFHFGKK